MKKSALGIILLVIFALILSGTLLFFLTDIFDFKEKNTEKADIDALIKNNSDTAFGILHEDTKPELNFDVRGYILNAEKTLFDSADSVFETIDAISPNTVIIRSESDNAAELAEAAKAKNLDVIALLPENKLSASDIQKASKELCTKFICIETDKISKAEEEFAKLGEEDILTGIYTDEALSQEKSAALASGNGNIAFWFVQIDSRENGNALSVINTWANAALASDANIYAVLRNDLVTDSNPAEIYSLVKALYNSCGFSGSVMYDSEYLRNDDHQTTTKLAAYYDSFNGSDYTTLKLSDFSVNDDKSSITISGESDKDYPVYSYSTESGKWTKADNSAENGAFSLTINLALGENTIILKHRNAVCRYTVDRCVDVMTSCSATKNNNTLTLTATAKDGAKVFASVANTYLKELTKISQNGDSAVYSAEFELSDAISDITNEQVSFAASFAGIEDIVMCNEEKGLSPYDNHGLGTADMCMIKRDYTETTSTASKDDYSDPTCTPQMSGALGFIEDYTVSDNSVICITSTGMKVYLSSIKLILDGYILPENNISLTSADFANGTELKFTQAYPTFIKVVAGPENYYKGYLERMYNIKSFESEYVDITFMNAASCSAAAESDITKSSVFKDMQWYTNKDEKTVTLHLLLKEKGAFYGYSLKQDGSNITISFKNDTKELSGAVIMLDAGHGGFGNPGTNHAMTVYEEEITLSIANKASKLLREKGATVILTRSKNEALSLSARAAMARNENPDIFVSIHCDGSDDTSWLGTHTFYYKNYSMPLAEAVHKQMINAYRKYYYTDPSTAEYTNADKGVKFYPFLVTRIEECPSVLVECGYLTNELDSRFLISDGGQQIIATAIAQGITDYIINF